MPRPKRSKVASSTTLAPKNEQSASGAANPTAGDDITATIAPAKKMTRKNPSLKDNLASNPSQKSNRRLPLNRSQAATKTSHTRGPSDRHQSAVEGDDNSALAALGKRRKSTMGTNMTSSTPSSVAPSSTARKNRSSSMAANSERMPSPRIQTPTLGGSTDDELYGLSPSGEISKSNVEVPQQSRRTSLQQSQSVLRAQGTPAIETSVLALANFRRRPRQPSIIRLVQQSSELGDDDFDLGDFSPEDESTPLHLTRRKLAADSAHNASKSILQTSSSRKRKFSAEDEAVTVPRSSPLPGSSPPAQFRSRSRSPSSHSHLQSESDNLSGHAVIIPSTEHQDAEPLSDTMAPPLSSSDLSSSSSSPVKTTSRPSKLRKLSDINDDKIRSYVPQRNTRARRLTEMKTQTLQSLLPRPRRRERRAKPSVFEIISSESEEEEEEEDEEDDVDEESESAALEDELGNATRRGKRAAAPSNARRKLDARASTTKRRPAAKSRASAIYLVPSTKTTTAAAAAAKPTRTYGRRATGSDKENESYVDLDDDENLDDTGLERSIPLSEDPVRAKEIAKMKNKFAEVDAWEMEFESVDMGVETSSPWR